ncbi:hypothetical protein BOX15_Mlig019999g1, partial [Macrostomum lignano]
SMSLFKARDWWRCQCGSGEEFDNGCLATGRLLQDLQQFVAIGSHSGILRIFKPVKGDATGTESTCLEKDLRGPILAVAIGNLISEGRGLAVLHDRKLAVYTLSCTQGHSNGGSAYSLRLAYEHSLKKSGYNLCCGPFGKVERRDFIAVQHLDAAVSVFEQESFSFIRYLPNAVLPGPMAYLPASDIFVTGNSARVVEAYKYNSLAVATDAQDDPKSRRVKHEWVHNSGELVLDIRAWPRQEAVLVLNYRSVLCLSEAAGQPNWALRFEVPPAAILPLTSNWLVASSTGQLLVLHENELLWGAQHSATPVQLQLVTAGQTEGLIVALTEDGRCDALYLGTDPSLPIMNPSSAFRDLDVTRLDGELRAIQGRIRQATSGASLPAVKETADLQLNFHVAASSRPIGAAPEVSVTVQGRTKSHIQEVQLCLQPPAPLQVSQPRLTFSFVDSSHPLEAEVQFSVGPNSTACAPASLQATVVATFTSTAGSPKCVQSVIHLPFAACVQPVLPEKQARCKLTLEFNKPPVPLDQLFPELQLPELEPGGQAVAFRYLPDSATVTLVASQTASKYRLQGDSLDQLTLPLRELRQRLRGHHGDALRCNLACPLPLPDYCELVDWHWECRQRVASLDAQLEQKAAQFRAVQKRLLAKFKDKTAGPLQSLDLLLESAGEQAMSLAEEAEAASQALRASGQRVCAAGAALAELLQLAGPAEQLGSVLSDQLDDFPECGLAEQLDAALTHLLRTGLSRSGAKDAMVSGAGRLEPAKDVAKLKKHVQMLCEKLARGATIAPLPAPGAAAAASAAAAAAGSVAPTSALPVIREPDSRGGIGGAPSGEDFLNGSLNASQQFMSPRAADSSKKQRHKKKKKQKKHHRDREDGEEEEEADMFGSARSKPAPRELEKASALLAPAAESAGFYD